MSALLKAELLRLVSRRLLVVLLVCMAGLGALSSAIGADGIRPMTAQEVSDAQRWWQESRDAWQDECGAPTDASSCEGWLEPELSDFLREPFGFGEYTVSVLAGFELMLLAVAAMVASFVGAEFASGNLGTQLLFTPRRLDVMAAKLAISVVAGFLIAVSYLATAVGLSAIMFLSVRGADDMSAGVGLPLALGRLVVLALLLALMSGGLAMGLGSTLIPLGVLAVVFIGSSFAANAIRPDSIAQAFLPSHILQAMALGRAEVFDWTGRLDIQGPVQVINYDWALGYSVIGTALIVVVAAWWFRRRDILG